MRKSRLIASSIFLVFSAALMIASVSMEYYSSIGPGPGFFPFWLSLILGLLSIIWIVQIVRSAPASAKTEGEETLFPRGGGLLRILSLFGALCFMIAFMEPLGFQLAMFAFLAFLLVALGHVKTWMTLIIAGIGSFGLFRVFTLLLDVQLPQSAIRFLAAIGL
ncbi:MAG TPA: tripartite tricarboxylate transporter TctB family protein [Spirochaetia bacterium]|nr:tripartite tricarboxylate transporter TctB family protein [Spirochaetia bacterium]HRZ65713.1 tripartite tricarboxylate transporter TctB family protein [Spirochaetia bacterium]